MLGRAADAPHRSPSARDSAGAARTARWSARCCVWPGDAQQVDAVLQFLRAVELGELDAQQDLLLDRPATSTCRLLTTVLANAAASATARSATSLFETCPFSAIESREAVGLDVLVGEGFLQHAAQRIEVQLHVDVVEGALRRSCSTRSCVADAESFAVQQDLARGDRARVDNVRIAGRDLADVGRIVDDDALADGQAQIFGALRAEPRLARQRDRRPTRR